MIRTDKCAVKFQLSRQTQVLRQSFDPTDRGASTPIDANAYYGEDATNSKSSLVPCAVVTPTTDCLLKKFEIRLTKVCNPDSCPKFCTGIMIYGSKEAIAKNLAEGDLMTFTWDQIGPAGDTFPNDLDPFATKPDSRWPPTLYFCQTYFQIPATHPCQIVLKSGKTYYIGFQTTEFERPTNSYGLMECAEKGRNTDVLGTPLTPEGWIYTSSMKGNKHDGRLAMNIYATSVLAHPAH